MPKAGTKKVTIDGEIRFLPEEEARLEVIVRRGNELQALIDRYDEEIAALRDEVVEIAERHRGARQSVRLHAPTTGVASVTWSQDVKVDATRALDLREPLGRRLWAALFQEKVEVRLAKGYQDVIRTAEPDVKPHVEAIAACVEVRARKPSVKFLGPGE
jgi:hypothetical protein